MNLPDCVAMAISVEDNSFIIELAIEDFELLDQEFFRASDPVPLECFASDPVPLVLRFLTVPFSRPTQYRENVSPHLPSLLGKLESVTRLRCVLAAKAPIASLVQGHTLGEPRG